MRPLVRAALAGLAYFGVIFAVGFAFGTLRVIFLLPRLGVNTAVLLELPIMLGLSWVTCRWLVKCYALPGILCVRLVMGGFAFLLLMLAEFGVSAFGFGRTLSEHISLYHRLPAQLGLAAQILFAVFPILQGGIGNSRD